MELTNGTPAEFDLNLTERPTSGKENMTGKAIFRGTEILCPVSTSSPLAIVEQPELRAYKLGKQKCSYNQVELVIQDVGGGKLTELRVSEAIETCIGPEVDEMLRESCLKFNVRFLNNNRMYLYIYVVYATPYGTSMTDNQSIVYHWIPVTRAKCRKACKGPVIRGLQRFGRMPRRNAASSEGEDSWKEPRHLYIAIDEASTHVCPRHETSKFRLLVAAYDDKNQLLGTTVSSSIRVLANNDAPLGAASFKLHCHVKGSWSTSTPESPVGNAGSRAYEKSGICRPPLQDIGQNSSPPRSHRSITTDDTAKHVEVATNQASLLCVDLSTNIIDHEKEVDENGFCEIRPTTFDFQEAPASYSKSQKENSLTDLCERLLVACIARQEYGQTAVALRSLATVLGARRRRILEIMNVLETISVVQDQGKERFLWLGSTQIARALLKLKGSVREDGESAHSRRNFFNRDSDGEVDNPMQTLSKKFVQLFLIHEKASYISWEQMEEYIVDGKGHMNDPETIRAKTRRLEEVARIFASLHLIKKVTRQKPQPSLVYEWLGSQGVAEHLVSLASIASTGIKRIDGRRTRTFRIRSRSRSPAKSEKRRSGAVRESFSDESPRRNFIHGQSSSIHDQCLQRMSVSSSAVQPKSKDQHGSPTQVDPPRSSSPCRQATSKYLDTDENAELYPKFLAPRRKRGQKPFKSISSNQAAATSAAATSGSISTSFRASCGDFTRDTPFNLCQSSLSGQIRGEIASQLDLSLSHQQSQIPRWKFQVDKLSTWVRPTEREAQYSSVNQEILEPSEEVAVDVLTSLDKTSHVIGVSEVSSSSDQGTDSQSSPDDVIEAGSGSTTTEGSTDLEGNKSYDGGEERDDFRGPALFTSTVSSCSTWQKWQRPFLASGDARHQHENSSVPDLESPAGHSCASSEVQVASVTSILPDSIRGSTVPRPIPAHQVPFKKRKFHIPLDTESSVSGETNSASPKDDGRSGHDQEQPLLCPLEGDRRSGQQAGLQRGTANFDPIGDLVKCVGPQAVKEILSRNPTSVFEYVMAARAFFSKQCAERVPYGKLCAERVGCKSNSKVVRLVANIGGFDISKLDEENDMRKYMLELKKFPSV